MSSEDTQQESQVLVVGGGFAGLSAADELTKKRMKVVLVSSQEYFEFMPSILRCLVQPEHLGAVSSSYTSHPFQFVHGTVIALAKNSATVRLLSGGLERSVIEVRFQFCIWAVGVGYSMPVKPNDQTVVMDQRISEISDWHERIKKAKR